jgi:hypothetical protein
MFAHLQDLSISDTVSYPATGGSRKKLVLASDDASNTPEAESSDLIPLELIQAEQPDELDYSVEEFPQELDLSLHYPSQESASPEVTSMQLHQEIIALRNARDEALAEVERLKIMLDSSSLKSSCIVNDNAKAQLLTGITSDVFDKLFTYLSSCMKKQKLVKGSLPLREQLFITLVRLRQNISFRVLSCITSVPKSTLIDYFWKWLDLMYVHLKFLIRWQDRETIYATIPPVFKNKFPHLTAIIDCFEIFIQSPSNLKARAQTYSNYKKHTSAKVFISCSPWGSINFVSVAWGGRASDIQIVRDSIFHQP